ncbi:MAG TPA: MFS transporter [Pyrinomonadaceae bacterium]|nr:MFS transporter [Pyrinomonadaceae bacterium]
MSSEQTCLPAPARGRAGRRLSSFALSLLLVEFLDEVLFGVHESAWPLIRDDLRLSYTQVGILLSVPTLFGNFVEPALGILADVWKRRAVILAGGVCYAASTLLMGLSYDFVFLLLTTMVLSPASGAFVGLSQAALMDAAPDRREQNMARWTLFGAAGNAAGPVAVALAVWAGVSWRWLFACVALFALVMVWAAWRLPFPTPSATEGATTREALADGFREAWAALRRREVVRWLVLLHAGDFMADVLLGFLALYFVDVVGAGGAQAATAVIVWTCVGLPGDFLILWVLERVRGLSYLRVSTAAVVVIFPAFLLAEGLTAKLVLLGLLGFVNAGWYPILAAQLYASMPGRSGTVMTVSNASGLVASLVPLALGAFAQRHGLGAMMWLLWLGPVALLAGLLTAPRAGAGARGA